MSWRSIQLNQQLCDQDRLILDLFQDSTVKYVGDDNEFKLLLNNDRTSSNLVLIINYNVWCSDIIKLCQIHLTESIDNFYIVINRYRILGNDTTEQFLTGAGYSRDIINMISTVVERLGYSITKHGFYDHDQGRHFNFVQPLTWVYGNKTHPGH